MNSTAPLMTAAATKITLRDRAGVRSECVAEATDPGW
jgi:hypothetical protein